MLIRILLIFGDNVVEQEIAGAVSLGSQVNFNVVGYFVVAMDLRTASQSPVIFG